MSDYGLKYHHAGSPEPPPLALLETSDVSPHGMAGVSGFSHPETVVEVGPRYTDLVTSAQDVALSKRDADQAVLNK